MKVFKRSLSRPPSSTPARIADTLREPAARWLLLPGALIWAARSYLLSTDAPELDYPFLGGDGAQWLADGFALAGAPWPYAGRPPLLPLLVALLEGIQALGLLIPLLALPVVIAPPLLYAFARRCAPPWAAATVGLALAFGHSWNAFSLEIMADVPATVLMLGSVLCLLALVEESQSSEHRTGRVAQLAGGAGLLGALAVLTQQAALLLPPIALLALLLGTPQAKSGEGFRWVSRPWFVAAGIFALGPILWFGSKLLFFGTAGDLSVQHWSLLKPNAESVDEYAIGLLALAGLPAVVLAVVGAVVPRKPPLEAVEGVIAPGSADRLGRAFALAWVLVVGVFFVFFYHYMALRFLVYLLPPLLVLSARGLAWTGERGARPVALGLGSLLVLFAAAPRPASPHDAGTVLIWPAPTHALRWAGGASDSGSHQFTGELKLWSPHLRASLKHSLLVRIGLVTVGGKSLREIPPGTLPREARLLWLSDDARQQRLRRQRLANGLRRPALWAPTSLMTPLLPQLELKRQGRMAEFELFEVLEPITSSSSSALSLEPRWLAATLGTPAHSALAAAATRGGEAVQGGVEGGREKLGVAPPAAFLRAQEIVRWLEEGSERKTSESCCCHLRELPRSPRSYAGCLWSSKQRTFACRSRAAKRPPGCW
ncbi:MAG: hypothetical protein AAGD01_11645 [Acidobacteriota bacterium]